LFILTRSVENLRFMVVSFAGYNNGGGFNNYNSGRFSRDQRGGRQQPQQPQANY